MKINKKNPSHWFYMLLFGGVTLFSLLLRTFTHKKRKTKIIVLYGHKLNGNLKGIYDYSLSVKNNPLEVYYLTMDPAYYSELRNNNINVLLATHISTIKVLAQSH